MTPSATQPARISRLVFLACLWGSNFFWIKIALRGLSPDQIVFVRLTLGALVLVVVLRISGENLPKGMALWGHLAIAAVLSNVVPYLLFADAERRVDSSIAGIINATTPLWTLLFAVALSQERRPKRWKLTGVGVGFAGALVIFGPWQHGGQIMSGAGIECLIASALYGVSFVYMARYLAPRALSPLALSAGQLVASSVLTAVTLPIAGRQAIHLRPDALVAVIVLGALGTGLAYVVNYQLITESGASATSVVTYLLPIVAVVLGALVLSESVPFHAIVGTIIVLAGVTLTRTRTLAGNSISLPRI